MPDILKQIVATKWGEIAAAKERVKEQVLHTQVAAMGPARGFRRALAGDGVSIIAEVKKASPSAGVIRADFDPVAIAKTYQAHGATCLSVLTDEHYFQGHLDYLQLVNHVVAIPILRKEFILDPYQIVEARARGADAILLIAEILPGKAIADLRQVALDLGLDVLVEFHDPEELPRVLDSGADLVGINNRDLRKFETRLEQTLELAPKIPRDVVVVGESGIKTHDDILKLAAAGVRAALVGESLMRETDIGKALDRLLNRGV